MINATVVGNLGGDAQFQMSDSDVGVLHFSLASNTRQKVDGEWSDVTTWVRVVMFGKRGESLAQYLTKGKQIAVRGELSQKEYTNKDGEMKTSLECKADDIRLLGGGDGKTPAKKDSSKPNKNNRK